MKECEGREGTVNASPAIFLLQWHQMTLKNQWEHLRFKLVRLRKKGGSGRDLSWIDCMGIIGQWISFCVFTFLFFTIFFWWGGGGGGLFISLQFFHLSLSSLICHLPKDLHPSIEYTQRTTQRNKSITHSITGTARPAGSGLGRTGRKVLWLLQGLSMSTLLAKFSSVSFLSLPLLTWKRYTPCI